MLGGASCLRVPDRGCSSWVMTGGCLAGDLVLVVNEATEAFEAMVPMTVRIHNIP